MRASVVWIPVGVTVIISVVPVVDEVRVSWVGYVVETEEEGGGVVGVPPTLVTVENKSVFVIEVIVGTVVVGLSILGVVV